MADQTKWKGGDAGAARGYPGDVLLSSRKSTAFHILCTRPDPPMRLVESFLAVAPTVVSVRDGKGRSPLHLACYGRQSLEVVQAIAKTVLRQSDEIGSWADNLGWNVAHILARFGAEQGVVSFLLNEGPIVPNHQMLPLLTAKDQKGRTPVQVACGAIARINKDDFDMLCISSRPSLRKRSSLLLQLSSEYRECLNMALVNAAGRFPKRIVAPSSPSVYCNRQKKVSVSSIWFWRPDDTMRLWSCLHKALTVLGSTHTTAHSFPALHCCLEADRNCETPFVSCLLIIYDEFACQVRSDDRALPLHVSTQLALDTDGWYNRIDQLIKSYPEAAAFGDSEGRVPIQLFVTSAVSWRHVEPVLTAWPEGLSRLQLPEAVFPLILSRLTRSRTTVRVEDLNSVFVILRHNPSLVNHS